jgi:hypothetical protein
LGTSCRNLYNSNAMKPARAADVWDAAASSYLSDVELAVTKPARAADVWDHLAIISLVRSLSCDEACPSG